MSFCMQLVMHERMHGASYGTATTFRRCALPNSHFTRQALDRMAYSAFLTLLALCTTAYAQDTYHCNALDYAQPGFRSDRRLYPPDKHDPRVWDDMHKVAFQNADCTWLAANFKDTGSSFVAILFAGFTQHKVSLARQSTLTL